MTETQHIDTTVDDLITTTFVGRQSELDQLHGALERCIADRQPWFVFIAGDGGMGKTWLAERFLQDVESQRPEILVGRGHCELESRLVGLQPAVDALDSLLADARRKRHFGKRGSFRFMIEVGSAWLDVITGGGATAARTTWRETRSLLGHSRPTQDNAFVQYGNILTALTKKVPAICYIDNLHWSDETSLSLLLHIIHNLKGRPIMFLCTYRMAEVDGLDERHQLLRAVLQDHTTGWTTKTIELDQGVDVLEYVEKRYPAKKFPPKLLGRVQETTRGHPLFVRALFDVWEGTEANGQQPWHLPDETELSYVIPMELTRLISEQLERLDPKSRRVVDCAAVEGTQFAARVVAGAIDLSTTETAAVLEELRRARRLVDELPQHQSKRLRFHQFAHQFYRKYVYEALSPSYQTELHQAIAECLEQMCSGECWVASELAWHFEKAGDFKRGARYALLAAESAQDRWAWSECEKLCTLGLTMLDKLPEDSPEKAWLRLDLLERSGQGFYLAEEHEKADARYKEALALAIALEVGPRRIAQLHDNLAATAYNMGQSQENLDYLERGLTVLRQHDVPTERLTIELQSDYISALDDLGQSDYEESVLAYGRLLDDAATLDSTPEMKATIARIHNYRAIALGYLSRYSDAAPDYRRAIELSEVVSDWRFAGTCCLSLASDAYWRSCPEEVEQPLMEATEYSERVGARDNLNWAKALRAVTLLLQDRAAEAEIILVEAIAEAEERDYGWNLVGMYVDLAAARLAQGRPADARATARQAIALAGQDDDPAENGWALKELGRAESALDNHAEATTYLRKALEIHRQAKQRHMAARAQGYLGQALLRAGQFKQGINELTEAIAILEVLQLNREADQFRKLLP